MYSAQYAIMALMTEIELKKGEAHKFGQSTQKSNLPNHFDKIQIFTFSKFGAELEENLWKILKSSTFIDGLSNKNDLKYTIEELFKLSFQEKKVLIIFVGAVGICVRKIAPFLKSKVTDPAVICIDDSGKFVIPVLSGHIGGANTVANFLAEKLGALPVITTSTDIHQKWAFDVWALKQGFDLKKIGNQKEISKFIQKINSKSLNDEKLFSVGIGCKKNTNDEKLFDFVKETFFQKNLPFHLIKSICSIDVKKDEKAILNLAKRLDSEVNFYSKDELNKLKGNFSESEFVKNIVGVDCVCERSAAKKQFDDEGSFVIIIKKIAKEGMTLSVVL